MNVIMRVFLNIFFQLVWIAISLIIGGVISMSIFDSLTLRSIFCGVFSILVYFLLALITYSIKATKDPDVQAASNLGMSITRFHLYQRIFDEYQDFLCEHDAESKEAYDKFKELFKQIPNPNEWRRYSKYREELERKRLYEELNKPTSHKRKVGDKIDLPMEDGGI